MMRNMYTALFFGLVVAIGGLTTIANANHSWNGYHFDITARESIKYPLRIGDNVSSSWDTTLLAASADWNKSVVKNKVVAGVSNANCDVAAGRTEVCNGLYGDTGWLAITQLTISPGVDGHITDATIKLNDTYFNTPDFNTNAWKSETVCHEIGHTYGLDHQDTNFNNANLGTCLDFTGDPDGAIVGQLSNEHPNLHDYEMIKSIYNHKHSRPKGGSLSVSFTGQDIMGSEITRWGESVGADIQGGKNSTFMKTQLDGTKVVTHVHWIE